MNKPRHDKQPGPSFRLGGNKITHEKAVEMLSAYRSGRAKATLLAEKYGISSSALYTLDATAKHHGVVIPMSNGGAAPAAAAPATERREAPSTVRDAIIYLREARTAINEMIRAGTTKQIDRAHLLTLLALSELER